MALDLTSVDAKLDHAMSHMKAIEDEFGAWIDSKLHRFYGETNPQRTIHSLVFDCGKRPDLVRWSLMFGDAIHNLRSTLDHLVYAVGTHKAGGSLPPGEDRLAYPITESPESFAGFCKGKLFGIATDINDPIIKAMERFQPYKRTTPDAPTALRLLRAFDDRDKHRLLHVVVNQIHDWKFGINGLPPGMTCELVQQYSPSNVEGATKIATFVTSGSAPDLKIEKITMGFKLWVSHDPWKPGANESILWDIFDLLSIEVGWAIDSIIEAVK